ncbi:MAG: hypothetical protein AMXMBFR47_15980 [Planctomycetota bacterium]
MNLSHAQRVREVFDAAVELDSGARETLLDRECGSDLDLRREIEELLRIDRREHLAIDQAMAEPLRDGSAILPSALPGKIGRYRILGLLGTGGMGVVYRARQEQPAREVALKTLRPAIATRRILARFNNEIATLGRLRHENIAQIYDAGTAQTAWGEQPYISMELVDGLPLLAYARRYNLPLRDRVELFLQLCDGVQFAHQQGVIHRDLKPANILVRDDPRTGDPPAAGRPPQGRVKILDFGVSRLVDRDASAQPSLATLTGELVGTIAYMSPEQLDGSSSGIDTRADVYALGAILFELIADRPPVDVQGHTVRSVLRVVREQSPALARSLADRPQLMRSVRGDLETIVAKAMDKDRTRRYASAAALADDLRRYLRQEPIAARPASVWYAARKFAARNRGLVVSSIVAAALLAAGAGGTLWGLLRANASAADRHLLLETAIETVSRIAADVVPALNDVSGTSEARRSLLEQLQRANDTVRTLAADSVRLWTCQADLLTAISVLERTEGRMLSALTHRIEAAAARRKVVEAAPDDLCQLRQLAINIILVGDCYKEQHERTFAERHYREAHALLRSLIAKGINEDWLFDDLVYSHLRLGENALVMHQPEEATLRFYEAIALCEQLEKRGAPADHVLNARQEILGQLGMLEFSLGRHAALTEYALQRLKLLRELTAIAPSNVVFANSLARVLVDAAPGLAALDDCRGAREMLDEAEPICHRLRDENRHDVEYLDVLQRIAAAQAKVAMRDGRPDDVLASVRESFAFGFEFGRRAADNREAVGRMSFELSNLCEIALETGYPNLLDRIRLEFLDALEQSQLQGRAAIAAESTWLVALEQFGRP